MKFLKRFSLFEVVLVLVILGIHLYAALSDAYNFPNAWFKRDDAYYYFKVAQNISEGLGSTFDGVNLTNGYHPLWMVICIPIFALARFDVILPLRVLLMVVAIMQAGSALLIYRLVKRYLSQAVAMAAASFWAFNSYIHSTVYEYGLETPIAILTLLWLIHRLSIFEETWRTQPVTKSQLAEIALLAAFVMFSRLDLVFLAVIMGVWIIFRGTTLRYTLLLDMFIFFASMASAAALRTGIDAYNTHYSPAAVESAILAIIIKIVALYFAGSYQPLQYGSLWKILRQTFFAITGSSILIFAISILRIQFGADLDFPRSAFVLDWGISLFFALVIRVSAYWFSKKQASDADQSPIIQLKTNWKTWLTEGLTYYGVLGGLLGLYMLFNKLMFGTSSPVSGQIKRWWGSMESSIYEEPPSNWPSFFGIGRGTFNAWDPATDLVAWLAEVLRPIIRGADKNIERYYISMAIFVILALILAFINKRRTVHIGTKLALIPLIAGSGIHILSYTATSYGGLKEWYWVSEMVLITLAGSYLIDLILRPLLRIKLANLAAQTGALLIGAMLAYNLYSFTITFMPHGRYEPDRRPMDVLNYLEENTPPGSIIGMTGGGNVGYFLRGRTIVNMDGLINSYGYFHALQAGEGPIYLGERGMTIVFANAQMMSAPPFYNQYGPYLVKFGEYGGKRLYYLLDEPKQ